MKLFHRLLPLLAVVVFLPGAFAADPPKPLKALLVVGGCCHDYAKQKEILKAGIEARAHVTVDIVYTADKGTKFMFEEYRKKDWGKAYDVVIHDECTADVKDKDFVEGILAPHFGGLPAVNLHCAMHCYRTGEEKWFEFCGIRSSGHGAQLPIDVTVQDSKHPILKGTENWTTFNEELYNNLKLYPKAVPLLKGKQKVIRKDKTEKEDEYVVAWTNEYGKGRVFNTTLGHNNATVADAKYLRLVTRGLLWACNKLTDEYLKPEPKEGVQLPKEELKIDPKAAAKEMPKGEKKEAPKKDNGKNPPPPTVEQLLKETKPAEGFTATIFATPDQANYPVFVSAAADGTLYVSSDQNGSLARDKHMGRIFRLRDTKGTGRADEVTTFVKDIDSPRGLVWDIDRLYVLHPPHLSVFIDKKGDGTDIEQKILVKNIAFTFKDRPADHTSNGLTLGIDGWLYAAIGDFGFMEAEGTDGRKLQLRGGGVVRVRTDGTGLELFSYGTRNILQVAMSPLLDGFARDNTNDGDGWDIRLHHFTGFENHGYPKLYKNFADEAVSPLADYGGGSGCGAAWIDDPKWPKAWNNRPYTADWGRGAIYAHPVEPKGSTFIEAGKPTEFVRLPRPTDIDIDASGAAYVSSWRGGQFKYDGPNVGYIARITPKDWKPGEIPDWKKMDDAKLAELFLTTKSQKMRLECQRRLLRLDLSAPVEARLGKVINDKAIDIDVRVATLCYFAQRKDVTPKLFFTPIQANDTDLKPFAVRLLGESGMYDLFGSTAVSTSVASTDARTRREALIAATRFGSKELPFAKTMPLVVTPLLDDPDALIAHTAVQCLAKLKASEACFAVLDKSTLSKQAHVGAARVLAMMHTKEVVVGLVERLQKETVSDRRHDLLTALCRLYHKEAEWKGESWGTRPDYRGPYYAPVVWEGTPAITAALENALANADAAENVFLGETMAKNRVKLGDPLGRLIDLAKRDPKALPILVEQLAKADEVPAAGLELLLPAAVSHPTPQMVQALVKSNRAPAFLALLDVLPKLDRTTDAGKQAVRAFLGAPSLEQFAAVFAGNTKTDNPSSVWAEAALLKIAASPISSVESKALAENSLKEGWSDSRFPRIIKAILETRDRSRVAELLELSEQSMDKAVSQVALDTLKGLGLEVKRVKEVLSSTGPKLKELKPDEAVAAGEKAKGEIWRGEQLFNSARCALCHTISPDQPSKGPYLGNIAKTYKRHDLAESIILPSKTLAQGFQTNIFHMNDGKSVTGYVTREAADKVTLRDDKGAEHVLLKKNIEERLKSNVSVMPEGLLAEFKPVDLASILDYLEDLAKNEQPAAKKKGKK